MISVWRVVLTPRAEADLADAHDWLQARNRRAAAGWLSGMRETIMGLATMPQAHPLAPEHPAFDVAVRRALFRHGTPWRIYFTVEIEEGTVHILHVT